MRLTKSDIDRIKQWGFKESDIEQICEVAKSKNTTYCLLGSRSVSDSKNLGVKMTISGTKAIELLGRERYLSGLCRCAFHVTAVREGLHETKVMFDSSKFFKNRG